MDRRMEVKDDFARNIKQYVMTERVQPHYIAGRTVYAYLEVSRELWDSVDDLDDLEEFVRQNLHKQLDDIVEQVFVYDEAFGEEEEQ